MAPALASASIVFSDNLAYSKKLVKGAVFPLLGILREKTIQMEGQSTELNPYTIKASVVVGPYRFDRFHDNHRNRCSMISTEILASWACDSSCF